MNKLFESANQYVKESDWKDIALIKFCLCSIGVIIGIHVAPKYKKRVTFAAAAVFIGTYIPLMTKFGKILFRENE